MELEQTTTSGDGAAGNPSQNTGGEGSNAADLAPAEAPDAGTPAPVIDPSNTYDYGLRDAQGRVIDPNTAVPAGATVVSTQAEADEAGYFGYAPGAANSEQHTLAARGAEHQRRVEARRAASLNQSAEAEAAAKAAGKRRSK